MAIYHLSAKVISRAAGSSALAAAAYRSAGRLDDARLGRHHDFTNKAGVVHSEVLLPEHAPEEWTDRAQLWNAVEAVELRKDAQLAREIEFALPRELDQGEAIRLAREFVADQFVDQGMVADLNVHWDIGADGEAKPHAHVMLSTRAVTEDGSFGAKERDWNRTDLLERWREAWAEHANARLAELDIDTRIDHRSLAEQGIDLEPQNKLGPSAARRASQGLESERLEDHLAIARRNGARILADPSLALEAITHQQASFTRRDLARFVHRHSADKDQFDRVLAAVRSSPELVPLGQDGRGEPRFTSRAMLETEARLEHATIAMDARRHHAVPERARQHALRQASTRGLVLSAEQRTAFEHVTGARGLTSVIGYAGSGKSAMLGVAREAWQRSGYEVIGAALSGIAAENLEQGSAIGSRTLASLEHQWSQDRELLSDHSVLVIDEAGMIGTRQMERVIAEAEKRRAKLVLVGDVEQLQAIEAGAAFRSIAARHGAVEITAIRRQSDAWQREATRMLATGRTGEALAAYEEAGHVHAAPTREDARAALVARWDRDRRDNPTASRIILTHTNEDVRALNEAARMTMRAAGELGEDVDLEVSRGARRFACGDRVMFLKNERSLGVKNGSLGTVRQVDRLRMAVLLDDGRTVAFDHKDYAEIDHGYAATIHKAQGMTVDRVHVLATPGLDRHAAYVALSRHRARVDLHYGEDDFADRGKLVRKLSRERGKDMASDYARAPDAAPVAEPKRSVFGGLRLPDTAPELQSQPRYDPLGLEGPPPPPILPQRAPPEQLEAAVIRHGKIIHTMQISKRLERPHTPEQLIEVARSREALHTLQPEAHLDLEGAMIAQPELVEQAAQGRTGKLIQVMQLETEMRSDPTLRADVFVARWQALEHQRREWLDYHATTEANQVGDRMIGMIHRLERDPQLESILRARKVQLGLPSTPSRSIGQSLADMVGMTRGRDRGIGL